VLPKFITNNTVFEHCVNIFVWLSIIIFFSWVMPTNRTLGHMLALCSACKGTVELCSEVVVPVYVPPAMYECPVSYIHLQHLLSILVGFKSLLV
jgi:hypothetical protein